MEIWRYAQQCFENEDVSLYNVNVDRCREVQVLQMQSMMCRQMQAMQADADAFNQSIFNHTSPMIKNFKMQQYKARN